MEIEDCREVYDKDNRASDENSYSIEVSERKRTINLYAVSLG